MFVNAIQNKRWFKAENSQKRLIDVPEIKLFGC